MTTAMIDRLRRLGTRLCTAAAMERRIEPTLADMRNEYLEACHLGRPWRARWIEIVGALAVVHVIVLVTLERGAESLLRPDVEMRSALLKLGAVFGAVVTVTAVALAWVPFNTTPVPRTYDASDLLYLLPQALPIAIPIALTIAIVSGLRASLAGRPRRVDPLSRRRLFSGVTADARMVGPGEQPGLSHQDCWPGDSQG